MLPRQKLLACLRHNGIGLQRALTPKSSTARWKTTQTKARERPISRPVASSIYAPSPSKPANAPLAPETSAYAASEKLQYPERLMIYDTGFGRTVFLGWTKIVTVWVFGFACVWVAPGFYFSGGPWWAPPAVVIGGAIPMVFMGVGSSPYVKSINVKVPLVARRSKETLLTWARSAPLSTPIELVTMRLIGLPKHTTVKLGDLRTLPAKFGRIANFEAVKSPGQTNKGPSDWRKSLGFLGEPRNKFYITTSVTDTRRSRAPGVWEVLREKIRQG